LARERERHRRRKDENSPASSEHDSLLDLELFSKEFDIGDEVPAVRPEVKEKGGRDEGL